MRISRRLIIASLTMVLAFVLVLPSVSADTGDPFLKNPIKCEDAKCLAVQIIRIFLASISIVALAMFMYGGFVFLTSGGNPEAVKKGKETLLWSSIGLAIIIASWAIVTYVLRVTTGAI